MGDILGFKNHERETPKNESVKQRVLHYQEFAEKVEDDFENKQAIRYS